MVDKIPVESDVKQYVLVDTITTDEYTIAVYLLNKKSSVKQYCKDTGLRFKEGLKALE